MKYCANINCFSKELKLKCSNCKHHFYCSKECHKEDWNNIHSKVCKYFKDSNKFISTKIEGDNKKRKRKRKREDEGDDDKITKRVKPETDPINYKTTLNEYMDWVYNTLEEKGVYYTWNVLYHFCAKNELIYPLDSYQYISTIGGKKGGAKFNGDDIAEVLFEGEFLYRVSESILKYDTGYKFVFNDIKRDLKINYFEKSDLKIRKKEFFDNNNLIGEHPIRTQEEFDLLSEDPSYDFHSFPDVLSHIRLTQDLGDKLDEHIKLIEKYDTYEEFLKDGLILSVSSNYTLPNSTFTKNGNKIYYYDKKNEIYAQYYIMLVKYLINNSNYNKYTGNESKIINNEIINKKHKLGPKYRAFYLWSTPEFQELLDSLEIKDIDKILEGKRKKFQSNIYLFLNGILKMKLNGENFNMLINNEYINLNDGFYKMRHTIYPYHKRSYGDIGNDALIDNIRLHKKQRNTFDRTVYNDYKQSLFNEIKSNETNMNNYFPYLKEDAIYFLIQYLVWLRVCILSVSYTEKASYSKLRVLHNDNIVLMLCSTFFRSELIDTNLFGSSSNNTLQKYIPTIEKYQLGNNLNIMNLGELLRLSSIVSKSYFYNHILKYYVLIYRILDSITSKLEIRDAIAHKPINFNETKNNIYETTIKSTFLEFLIFKDIIKHKLKTVDIIPKFVNLKKIVFEGIVFNKFFVNQYYIEPLQDVEKLTFFNCDLINTRPIFTLLRYLLKMKQENNDIALINRYPNISDKKKLIYLNDNFDITKLLNNLISIEFNVCNIDELPDIFYYAKNLKHFIAKYSHDELLKINFIKFNSLIKTLTRIQLSQVDITANNLYDLIKNNPNLEQINISETDLENVDFNNIGNNNKITNLYLTYCDIEIFPRGLHKFTNNSIITFNFDGNKIDTIPADFFKNSLNNTVVLKMDSLTLKYIYLTNKFKSSVSKNGATTIIGTNDQMFHINGKNVEIINI